MATQITALLQRAAAGDTRAADNLLPLIYDELRALASSYLRRESPGHTFQTTALVHEAYLKLVGQSDAAYDSRSHFFAVAAQAMRRILVNHARDRDRLKRGGNLARVDLDASAVLAPEDSVDLVALDEALDRLAALDARKARTVEMRFFAGMEVDAVAAALGVGTATVKRDWDFARVWLYRELSKGDGHGPAALAPR
jgi:RNA polymerase sigma-70 factor (ECF subfamily)